MKLHAILQAGRSMVRSIRVLLFRKDGVAAIEFAMVAPLMLLLFVGSVEFSQALTVDRRVSQIASSTADLVAREKSITTADMEGIMDIIDHLMSPYDNSRLRVTLLNVYSAINNASDVKVCWSYNHNGGANTYSDNQSYSLPSGILGKGSSAIVAEVVYDYQPLIFNMFIESVFRMEEKFYLKPRLSNSVEYNGKKCL
ncbi:MAG TPA: TadE/TadG family type IV pilus assembly protein [Hyphomicrobiaceae bacterium]|nr:TadE/TadG family type IV pilus assembly protein [Hyphomicrobiaceae bacterium]